MSDVLQMIVVFAVILLILIFARKYRSLKMIKVRDFILADLKTKGAVTPETAVELSYAHKSILNIGLRDDRPKVLKQLIQFSIIGVTEEYLFYLNESEIPAQTKTNAPG